MPKYPPHFPYPRPEGLTDTEASELRSWYDNACEEVEQANGLVEWPNEGPSPEGYYHPGDIADAAIDHQGFVSAERSREFIEEVHAWLRWG